MATQDYTALKARVAALGHQLIEDDWTEADRDERPAPGLYVLDPTSSKLVLTYQNCGGSDDRTDALREIAAWCAEIETGRTPAVTVESVRDHARMFDYELAAPIDGGYKLYEPNSAVADRDFETLAEVDDWLRNSAPQTRVAEAQSVFYGIGAVVRLLGDELTGNSGVDRAAVISTLLREVQRGSQLLDQFEAATQRERT